MVPAQWGGQAARESGPAWMILRSGNGGWLSP
jgi:hypothetical protein